MCSHFYWGAPWDPPSQPFASSPSPCIHFPYTHIHTTHIIYTAVHSFLPPQNPDSNSTSHSTRKHSEFVENRPLASPRRPSILCLFSSSYISSVNLCMHGCHSNPKVKRWGCYTLIPLLLYIILYAVVRFHRDELLRTATWEGGHGDLRGRRVACERERGRGGVRGGGGFWTCYMLIVCSWRPHTRGGSPCGRVQGVFMGELVIANSRFYTWSFIGILLTHTPRLFSGALKYRQTYMPRPIFVAVVILFFHFVPAVPLLLPLLPSTTAAHLCDHRSDQQCGVNGCWHVLWHVFWQVDL